jgi:hypothetical protein
MPAPVIPESMLLDYLRGGLRWSATRHTHSSLDRAIGHYQHLAGQGFHHLPFFLIADLTELTEAGLELSFVSEAGMGAWDDAERALRLQYENRLFGRLLGEPRILQVLELLRNHRADTGLLSPAFVGRSRRLMALLLAHIAPHYPDTPRINPAHLRGFPAPPPTGCDEAHDRFVAACGDVDFFPARLRALLGGLAAKVHWSELLQPEDLFELEHHDVLSEPAQRIGCRQIIEVSRRLGEIDPRQVAVSDDGAAETAFIDESHYPTGGLAGLTNRGSMENLVLSELVYIDRSMDIDLFDLRFLEGELLYYLRDDGILRRKRRTVHLVIDPEQVLRQKPRGYPFQLSVIVQGMILRIVRDLLEVFSDDAILIHISYLHGDSDAERWQRELVLLELLLRDELSQGLVTLSLTPRRAPRELLAGLHEPRRKVYIIAIAAAQKGAWREALAEALSSRPALYGLCLAIGQAAPQLATLPLEGASFPELSALKTGILATLVGLKSGGTHHA